MRNKIKINDLETARALAHKHKIRHKTSSLGVSMRKVAIKYAVRVSEHEQKSQTKERLMDDCIIISWLAFQESSN
jgi:hypothetical protein